MEMHMWPSNKVSATQVSESGTKNEPDNDHDDTLEGEISRLETTIHDLESCNDLPDVGDFDELEEGEILDSIIYLGEIVTKKKKSYTCDTTDGEIFDSDDEIPNLKHNGKSKSTKCVDNSIEVIDLTHTPNHCRDYTKEKEPVQCQKVSKSVASPKRSEEVSHKYKDCQSSDVNHLHNECGNGLFGSMQYNKCDEKCITSSVKSIKEDFKEKSVSHENQDLGKNDMLEFDIDISDFEEHIKHNNGSHPAFPVSSTPCRTKFGDFQKWKPKFLSPKESFLILDECGEVSDPENSVCNSPLLSLAEKPVTSKEETNVLQFSEKDDLQKIEQREVAFGQGGDLKVVVKMTIDEDERHPLTVEPSVIKNTFIEDDTKPQNVDFSSNHEHTDMKCDKDRIVPPINDEMNGDICVQSSKVIAEDLKDLKVVVKGGEKSIEVVDTQMSTAIKHPVIPNLSLNTNHLEHIGEENMHKDDITGGQTVENSKADNASTDEMPLEQKPKTVKSEVFLSNNPQENDDNNNPEWELLRKLETDEERYRAVRERWRNLVVPDPNKDLTHRTWRICQNAKKTKVSASVTSNSEEKISGSDVPTVKSEGQRKRAFSEQASSKMQRAAKRPRTQSCTATFDVKLQQLRIKIEYEKQRITDEEHLALLQLGIKQNQQINYLRSFCYSHALDEEMRKLHHQQIVDVEEIHKRYDNARLDVERQNSYELGILESALEEVKAFHKFYQGLDHDSNTGDTLFLSESQLEELWATERLYEEYSKYYS